MTDEYVPPQNLDAEESVLGSMMLSPRAIDAVSEIVTPEDFYRESHGRIFAAAIGLSAKGEPVDALTLAAELDRQGDLETIGGKFRIHELASLAPATANAHRYAEIIREQALRRKLVRAGSEIERLGYEGIGDIDALLAEAEGHLSGATDSSYHSEFAQIGDGIDNFVDEIAGAVESGVPIFGTKTGFPDLDNLLSGLHGGQMIVVAARPGVGKSMLCQNVSENIADRGGPVAYFTLEMSRREFEIRALTRKTRIPTRALRTGKISADELDAVKRAAHAVKQRPMYVEDNPTITPTELRARVRRLHRQVNLELLVVDYLQLMTGDAADSKEGQQHKIAAISRSLKVLAKELHIPVIAISQLNREVERREEKRPTLADLRDSGAIEQDADVVIFIYREEVYKAVDAADARDAEIIVAKNRMGEQDTVKLLFHGKRQEFLSPARGERRAA